MDQNHGFHLGFLTCSPLKPVKYLLRLRFQERLDANFDPFIWSEVPADQRVDDLFDEGLNFLLGVPLLRLIGDESKAGATAASAA